MTSVTVLRTKFARAWPKYDIGEAVEVVELLDALETDYDTDAHFAAYATPNARRLSKAAIDRGVSPTLTVVVFDVDCSETHGTPTPAPESWRQETRAQVRALAEDHPGPYYYETRGGARVVYLQEEATVLQSHEDAKRWRQDYLIACAYLRRRYGIAADPGCSDWQRLYRLPYATRDKGGEPENWPMWCGQEIGPLMIRSTPADVRAAQEMAGTAFRERRVCTPAPCTSDGFGLLYHLLRARGDIFGERDGGFVVRCPREREHTAGATGDGSTVLYLPGPGEEIGIVYCLHAHCQGVPTRDWLRAFSDAELEAARAAAGIQGRTG